MALVEAEEPGHSHEHGGDDHASPDPAPELEDGQSAHAGRHAACGANSATIYKRVDTRKSATVKLTNIGCQFGIISTMGVLPFDRTETTALASKCLLLMKADVQPGALEKGLVSVRFPPRSRHSATIGLKGRK